MPTVFYGDELGVQGIREEEYRAPMPWETGNLSLLAFFRKAIAMRHALAPLREGDFRVLSAEMGSRVFCFRRCIEKESVTVAINAGDAPAVLPFTWEKIYWAEGVRDGTLFPGGFAVLP